MSPGVPMTAATDAVLESTAVEVEEPQESDKVSTAYYPISQPLVTILRVALSEKDKDNGTETINVDTSLLRRHTTIERDSLEQAMEQLLRNAFVAMDSMFFSTPAWQRKRPSFQHRTCIRISTNIQQQTLTITDLGIGMTRSDLINSLGAGGHLSKRALLAARIMGSEKVMSEEKDDSDDTDSDDEDDTTTTCSNEEDVKSSNASHLEEKSTGNVENLSCPCSVQDIGGFYSALCTLAVGVEIGTKSKFDEYYTFELKSSSEEKNNFSHFCISRPMAEGISPTATNGYHQFTDVRGDSGTRVTLYLNSQAVEAGFLDQENVLRPCLQKILEQSPYSVVLENCCDEEERMKIIDANREEEEDTILMLAKDEGEDKEDFDEEDSMVGSGIGTGDDQHLLGSYNTVKERAKYIPLRLSMGERKMLRLVEATMACCDYTTEVDKPFKSSTRRTHAQLKGVTSVFRGMVTSCDYGAGQTLVKEDNYSDYAVFFQQMFEIARRHKIMNPEKMRTEYGKLIYLLQDAVSPSVQPHLDFSCIGKIRSVYTFLEERGGLAILDDSLIDTATREIIAGKKKRSQINTEIKRKEKAVAILKHKYQNPNLSSEDIHLCLYSICDNDSFLNSNRVPIDKAIDYLKLFFSPDKMEEGYSLSIVSGKDGSRLSHSHDRQYYFALQSLTLWRDIIDDMFRLWAMAEEDLLSESVTYSLQDTGQGMQRVQQSPLTYKAMQQILFRVQSKVHKWVGSNVIHLGDHNVPNALTFIDKYTQVPRILSPIVSCLENIERICEEDEGIREFVTSGFGGVEQLKKDILYDFFKSAFDGSGADNFYDAGSCIDGRLTSAWNWCSQLQCKPFYCIFKLAGFTGFDGEFK